MPDGVASLNVKPLAVIPSRYASVRFPGKPLAMLGGRPLVQHVVDRCTEAQVFSAIIVATDDERIAGAVRHFGGQVAMTSVACPSGTDRVAEVARQHPDAQVLINVQGDEPLISPDALRELAAAFEDPEVRMATLIRPLLPEERQNPNVVKAVLAANGDALYFSRADLPFDRDGSADPSTPRYAHLGLYGYRRETLLEVAGLPPSLLEQTERLEQLRALEAGIRIRCRPTLHASFGVDTPEDLARAEALWQRR